MRREERRIQALTRQAAKFLRIKKTSIDVFLIDEIGMRYLMRSFFHKNKSTNVLAFPESKQFPEVLRKGKLGEIYICLPYIKRKKEDVRLMLIHGILHLLGYNHERKNDRMKMQKLEIKFLSWLGNKF